MNKIFKFFSILILSLLLTACGGSSNGGSTPQVENTQSTLTANAGSDKSYLVSTAVTLNASASTGEHLSYHWKVNTAPASVTLSDVNASSPTFTPTVAGTYIFTVEVTDAKGVTASDSVSITITKSSLPAKSNAGADQSVKVNDKVTLNGSLSTGTNIRYEWSVDSSPVAVKLSNTLLAQPTFTATTAGRYIFDLKVTDGNGGTDMDSVIVTVTQTQTGNGTGNGNGTGGGTPSVVAKAGADRNVTGNSQIVLDANKSTGTTTLNYAWSVVKYPSGTNMPTLISPSSVSTRVYVRPGEYEFKVTVTDANGNVSTDTILIHALNNPVAKIIASNSTNSTLMTGDTISLDGTSSIGSGLSYQWSMFAIPGGNTAQIRNANSSIASIVPNVIGPYGIRLTITDALNVKKSTTVNINSVASIADAGSDVNIHVGDTLNLDGSASKTATNNTRIFWETMNTPTSTQSYQVNALMSTRYAYTTSLTPAYTGTYLFKLSVDDNTYQDRSADTVTAKVFALPVSNAGADATVTPNTTYSLDGTQSTGESLTYDWSVINTPNGSSSVYTFSDANTSTPSFNGTTAGRYGFTLVVTDHSSAPSRTATDNVYIDNVIH